MTYIKRIKKIPVRGRHGMQPSRRRNDVFERFARFVVFNKETKCWEWVGSLNSFGYGQFRIGCKHHGTADNVRAHRFSYEVYVGKIPEEHDIDHLCRNRRCVNPTHLEPVTEKENALRGIGPTAVNARKTHCNRGHILEGWNLIKKACGRKCRVCVYADNMRRRAIHYGYGKFPVENFLKSAEALVLSKANTTTMEA